MARRLGILICAGGLVLAVGCSRRCCEMRVTGQSVAAASDEKAEDGGGAKVDKPTKDKSADWVLEDAKAERKETKLQRALDVARMKVEQSRMAMDQTLDKKRHALEKAERALDMEERKFATFQEDELKSRIAWSELRLQQGQDRLMEDREELQQLEQMYSSDDFADGTKEIVLERGRRRLERSEKDAELRLLDQQVLISKTIPIETAEFELKLDDKRRALTEAREDLQEAELDARIKMTQAEGAVREAEDDLATHREETAKKVRERAEE